MVQALRSHGINYAPDRWDHLQCDDGMDVRSGCMHAPKVSGLGYGVVSLSAKG